MSSDWDIFSGSEPWENGDGFRKIYSFLEKKVERAVPEDCEKYSSQAPSKTEDITNNMPQREKMMTASLFDVYEGNCCSVTSYAGVLSTKDLKKTESVIQFVLPQLSTPSAQITAKENSRLYPKRKRLSQKKRFKTQIDVRQQCVMQEQKKENIQLEIHQSYTQRSIPSKYYTFGTMHLEEHGEMHPYVGMEKKKKEDKSSKKRLSNRKTIKPGTDSREARKINSKTVDKDGFEDVGKKKRARSVKSSSEISRIVQRTRFQDIEKMVENGEIESEYFETSDCDKRSSILSQTSHEKNNRRKKTREQGHTTHFDCYKRRIQNALRTSQDRDVHLLAPRYFGLFESLKKKWRLDYYDRIARNSSNVEFKKSIEFLRSIIATSIFSSIEKMFLEKYTHFPPPTPYDYFYSAVSYFLP